MRTIKVGRPAIGTIVELVAGDVDRISDFARTITAARGVVERLRISV